MEARVAVARAVVKAAGMGLDWAGEVTGREEEGVGWLANQAKWEALEEDQVGFLAMAVGAKVGGQREVDKDLIHQDKSVVAS
mgnify:CR=1 FL=1